MYYNASQKDESNLSISVLHFFVEQLSQGKSYNKYCRLCTFTYILENVMQKFDLDQKV